MYYGRITISFLPQRTELAQEGRITLGDAVGVINRKVSTKQCHSHPVIVAGLVQLHCLKPVTLLVRKAFGACSMQRDTEAFASKGDRGIEIGGTLKVERDR